MHRYPNAPNIGLPFPWCVPIFPRLSISWHFLLFPNLLGNCCRHFLQLPTVEAFSLCKGFSNISGGNKIWLLKCHSHIELTSYFQKLFWIWTVGLPSSSSIEKLQLSFCDYHQFDLYQHILFWCKSWSVYYSYKIALKTLFDFCNGFDNAGLMKINTSLV